MLWIPFQHFVKVDGGRTWITPGVEGVKTR